MINLLTLKTGLYITTFSASLLTGNYLAEKLVGFVPSDAQLETVLPESAANTIETGKFIAQITYMAGNIYVAHNIAYKVSSLADLNPISIAQNIAELAAANGAEVIYNMPGLIANSGYELIAQAGNALSAMSGEVGAILLPAMMDICMETIGLNQAINFASALMSPSSTLEIAGNIFTLVEAFLGFDQL